MLHVMIVGFVMNKLISFSYCYDFLTIYSQSLKGLTWNKPKSSYIMGQRDYHVAEASKV